MTTIKTGPNDYDGWTAEASSNDGCSVTAWANTEGGAIRAARRKMRKHLKVRCRCCA